MGVILNEKYTEAVQYDSYKTDCWPHTYELCDLWAPIDLNCKREIIIARTT